MISWRNKSREAEPKGTASAVSTTPDAALVRAAQCGNKRAFVESSRAIRRWCAGLHLLFWGISRRARTRGRKELALLTYLYECGTPVCRDQLLRAVWNCSNMVTRTVDQTVATLRRKLNDDSTNPKHLLTIHGIGYQLRTILSDSTRDWRVFTVNETVNANDCGTSERNASMQVSPTRKSASPRIRKNQNPQPCLFRLSPDTPCRRMRR